MATLDAIRTAVASTIATAIPGLATYPVVPDNVVLPALVVSPVESDFTEAMGRGLDTWTFDLIVMVPTAEPAVAQPQLDAFTTGAGPSSIRQAIFNARTLGLNGVDAHVSGMTAYNLSFSVAGVDSVAAALRLVVHTKGTE